MGRMITHHGHNNPVYNDAHNDARNRDAHYTWVRSSHTMGIIILCIMIHIMMHETGMHIIHGYDHHAPWA